jgi:GT2 family glycosyltransferase
MTAPWRVADIDLDRPLEPLRLAPGEGGAALTIWRHGRPVGFLLVPLPEGSLAAADLAALIAAQAGPQVFEEEVRRRLDAAAPPPVRWPSVTIAVCTRDHPALLDRLLRSLEGLERPPGPPVELEVLVVDNAPSDDATRRLVQARPGVRYECEPRPGLDFARNRAVGAAQGELLAFLDDDVTVEPAWLRGLLEAWAENPDAGAITGQVLPLACDTEAQVLFERRGGFRRGFAKARWGRECAESAWFHPCHAGSFGAGCNMVFATSLLRELGGFDEALDTGPPLPGGGDLDIFYRVIRAGRPLVYEPSMVVRHEHRRDMAQLKRQYWSWGLGFIAFVAKCHRTDPPFRQKQRRMITWWFKEELKQIGASLCGRHVLPPDFLLAELWGGIGGLLGGYGRSERRTARIRAASA